MQLLLHSQPLEGLDDAAGRICRLSALPHALVSSASLSMREHELLSLAHLMPAFPV